MLSKLILRIFTTESSSVEEQFTNESELWSYLYPLTTGNLPFLTAVVQNARPGTMLITAVHCCICVSESNILAWQVRREETLKHEMGYAVAVCSAGVCVCVFWVNCKTFRLASSSFACNYLKEFQLMAKIFARRNIYLQ